MKETTRQKLIDATFETVYSHGYQGAALADILKAAGVHKGSMYHFFANKKEMALTALREKMRERFGSRYLAIAEGEPPYLPRLYNMLRDTSYRDFKRGCPLANLVQEMSNLDADFDQALKESYIRFRGAFKLIYDKALEAGELAPCDTGKLALYSVTVLEGAILSAKASGDAQDYLDVVEMLTQHLRNFQNDKNKNEG